MNITRLRGVLCAAFAWLCTSAGAHGPDIKVEVTPLQAEVNYSRAATATRPAVSTFLAYAVTVTNLDDDTLKNLRFVGTTSVTEPTEKATFLSAQGASCVAGADASTVECSLGSLARGQSLPAFTLFFAAPLRSTALPAGNVVDCTGTDCVRFAGKVSYSEDRWRYRSPSYELQAWSAAPVALAVASSDKVRSAVPPGGLTLATGDAGFSTATDRFTTEIVVPSGYVPPAGGFATAAIDEAVDPVGCSALATCYRSTITVPGNFSPYLTVILRVDAADIPKGRKIGSVLVSYEGLVIGDCASPTTPRTDGIPCIAKRVAYPKSSYSKDDDKDDKYRSSTPSTPVPPDLAGDFEWTILNLKNGSYKIF